MKLKNMEESEFIHIDNSLKIAVVIPKFQPNLGRRLESIYIIT